MEKDGAFVQLWNGTTTNIKIIYTSILNYSADIGAISCISAAHCFVCTRRSDGSRLQWPLFFKTSVHPWIRVNVWVGKKIPLHIIFPWRDGTRQTWCLWAGLSPQESLWGFSPGTLVSSQDLKTRPRIQMNKIDQKRHCGPITSRHLHKKTRLVKEAGRLPGFSPVYPWHHFPCLSMSLRGCGGTHYQSKPLSHPFCCQFPLSLYGDLGCPHRKPDFALNWSHLHHSSCSTDGALMATSVPIWCPSFRFRAGPVPADTSD